MAKSTFSTAPARIEAIGIGGGGSNATTRMVNAQALALAETPICIQLGGKLTRGLGAGGDYTTSSKAAAESHQTLQDLFFL